MARTKTARAAAAGLKPELVVPFKAYPQFYGMIVTGDCCAPDLPDGEACVFDQMAPVEAGDYVAIWLTCRTPDGSVVIRPMVKRLVLGIDPRVTLPHVFRPGDELTPIVWFETTRPARQYRVSLRGVYGLHKVVGVGRGAGTGEEIDFDQMEPPPKRERHPHRLRVLGTVS